MRKSRKAEGRWSDPSLRLAARPKQKAGHKAGRRFEGAGFMYTRKKRGQSTEGLIGLLRAVYANRPSSTQGQLDPVETKAEHKENPLKSSTRPATNQPTNQRNTMRRAEANAKWGGNGF